MVTQHSSESLRNYVVNFSEDRQKFIKVTLECVLSAELDTFLLICSEFMICGVLNPKWLVKCIRLGNSLPKKGGEASSVGVFTTT